MRRFFAMILLTAGAIQSCFATDYYVSTQTEFDAVKNSVLHPGDAILLERGQHFVGMLAPTGTGTEAAPIRIDAYGEGERPQIHAMGVNEACIRLSGNPSFWEIQGLELTNTDGTDLEQGDIFGILVYIDNGEDTYRHIYIHDFYIHDVNGAVPDKGRGGIHVRFDGDIDASNLDDLRITGNRIEDVGGVGIATSAACANVDVLEDGGLYTENLWTRVYIASNRLDRIGRNGLIIRGCEYGVVEYNTVGNTSLYDKGHNIFCFDTLGITMQYNETYGNTAVGTEGDRGGFDADYNCVDTLIQYNYSHDNEWFCGIMKKPNRNIVIRYNVSQNEEQGFYFYGFDGEHDCESVHIYNNTHYVGAGFENDVVVLGRTAENTIFENNIFYFEEGAVAGFGAEGINTFYTHNLYYNLTPHASDLSPVTGDPLFTLPGVAGTQIDLTTMGGLRGYQLLPGSPAIDAATVMSNSVSRDIAGHVIDGGGADLGAFEYAGPVSRVTFDFLEGSVWDGGAGGGRVGSHLTLTNALTGESIQLTAMDVIGQDGRLASEGAGHTLNVVSVANYLGLNDEANPGGFDSESRFFNPNEGWVFSFNVDVYLENIDLASQTSDAELTLSSAVFDDVVLADGQPGDVHDLEYRYVPAGTELTLLMTTPTNGVDTGIGVEGLTVAAVSFLDHNPMVLQAESYDAAVGMVPQLCTDVGGGEMVVFDDEKDEIYFEVEVPASGSYLIGFRVAVMEGAVHLDLQQNQQWIGGINRVITGDATWTTIQKLVWLEAGSSTLKVSSSDGNCRLNWVQFEASEGLSVASAPAEPENSALNQTANASNVHSSNYGPEKAMDGNPETRWATSESPAWLEVDFGETVWVNGVQFNDFGDRIRSYEIQVYDGEWKTVFTGGDPGATQTDWFPAAAGSKVRLQTVESTYNPSIWEFEVFTVSGGEAVMELAEDAVALEWPNAPGVTYALQSSTNLSEDAFTTTIESGIPSLEESNRIAVEMTDENAVFYRIIAE
jgi:hypothetical protein